MTAAASEHWTPILADVPHLSSRYRARHALVLAHLAAANPHADIDAATGITATDPTRAARYLLGLSDTPRHDHALTPPVRITELHGHPGIAEQVATLASRTDCTECMIASQRPLQQTRVPLHPSRRATLIELANRRSLVALLWGSDTVTSRAEVRARIHGIADRVNAAAGPGALKVGVPDEYAFARSEAGDLWVFSPNYGRTLEDTLRDGWLPAVERARVVETLARLRRAMLEDGYVWQGFAPRNMFLHRDTILLIDFEQAADSGQSAAYAEMLAWHRVYFADSLTEAETLRVFPPAHIPDLEHAPTLHADAFERALLGRAKVDWPERQRLLEMSAALEGRHRRAQPERGELLGHELGHFWGDFLDPAVESEIFKALTGPLSAPTRSACLEVFEAAMEADICRLMVQEAEGVPAIGAPRTCALTRLLADKGPEELAGLRLRTADWYARVDVEPHALVDEALFGTAPADGHPALKHLLVGDPAERSHHRSELVAALDAGLEFLHPAPAGQRFFTHSTPDTLRAELSEPLPVDGSEFAELLQQLEHRIARTSIAQSAPGYLAFPDSGNALAALAGSILAPMLNQNMIAVDRSAPSASFATIQVVEWLRELVGYDATPLTQLRGIRDVAGLWTPGGHLSNHIAMLTALGRGFPAARQSGLRALPERPTIIMAGAISHYSHSDAAFHLGLGWDAVIPAAATAHFTTDPASVDQLLQSPAAGTRPFMVVGVAGNCRTTGLDDLEALAEVCERHGVWLHVDACHGGSLLFDDELRARHLNGIERADSVSIDPHKGLFTPYPSSYVLFRERGALTQFSRHTGTVLADGVWDIGLITPFLGSHGFEALATWMLLKHLGTRRLGQIVRQRLEQVRHLERRIEDTRWFVCLNDADFYRLTFVFCPPAARAIIARAAPADRARAAGIISEFSSRLNSALYRDGRVCFDEHTLTDLGDTLGLGPERKYSVLACCPGNPLTSREDLEQSLQLLTAAASALTPQLLDALASARHPDPARLAGPAGWDDPA